MVMNAFDTNFDNENEVYAVNTVAHYYMHNPIPVTVGQAGADLSGQHHRVRSAQQLSPARHVLRRLPDGHRARRPSERTDTLMLCQGERAILETTFRYPGDFMFHAHQSEFAELGWMGLFRATEAGRDT